MIFECGYINGKKEGIAKYYFTDGSQFIVNFVNNQMHGKGKLYQNDGKPLYEVTYINGKQINIENKSNINFNNSSIREFMDDNFRGNNQNDSISYY